MLLDNYKTIGEVIDLPDPTFKSELNGMSIGEISNLKFMLSQEYHRSIIVQGDLTNKMAELDSDTPEFKELKDLSMSLYAKMQSIEDKNLIASEKVELLK